jgi:D-glucosaminate-6-phosphate ammonia-lyase
VVSVRVGRRFETDRKTVAGLVRALELFVDEDEAALVESWVTRANQLADGLSAIKGIDITVTGDETSDVRSVPTVVVPIEDADQSSAEGLVRRLRNERPRIIVGEQHVDDDVVTLDPRCLHDDQLPVVVDRVRDNA